MQQIEVANMAALAEFALEAAKLGLAYKATSSVTGGYVIHVTGY